MTPSSSSASPAFTLRAVTPTDYVWLWNLKRLTMRAHVEETWGSWDDIAQEKFFREHFSPQTIQMIVSGGRDAGLLNVEREPNSIFLANLQIHPAFQNQGLGSAVVRTVIDSAHALHLPVRLQVLKVNVRARDLYLRLGFVLYDETLTHFLMRHSAPQALKAGK